MKRDSLDRLLFIDFSVDTFVVCNSYTRNMLLISSLKLQCLQHRALNPDEPMPEISSVIADYLKPPSSIIVNSQPVLDRMKKLFRLEVVEKKKEDQTGEAMFRDE